MITKFIILFNLFKCINSYIIGFNYYNNNLLNIKMNLPEYKPSVIINQLAKSSNQIDNWNINELITNIDKHDITSITLIKRDGVINGLVAIDSHVTGGLLPSLSNLHFIESGIPKINDIVLDKIINNNIYYDIVEAPETNMGMITSGINILSDIFIIYFLFSTITNILQRFNGGGGLPGMMNKNINSKDILIDANMIETRFVDIAGCDEAKYELKEIVDFLQNPEKYSIAGAKIPKGVLLEGPPGTGKTLLARAVAGESGVSFISISASEFIQMFVGVGAARVRNLFETARKNQPCVIFIDEIDAIGRKRGEQLNGGGNEEREQTLNQILTNMDGFTKSESIVVLAATNRADILDKALTRSGRFDRKITVGLPDKQGRMAILDVQLKNKHVDSKNTDYDKIAQLTSGFSGADIENMANEAIILALRDNKTKINTEYLLKAYEKITIGLPITNQIGNIYKDQLVAYHESGHTVTALLFKDMLTVRKVTINANTNGGGGYTLFTPLEKYIQYPTKKYFLANMIVAMGGRAAEIVLYNNVSNIIIENNYNNSILFGDINDLSITAGASQDLKQIDKLARQYIELFGIDGNNIIEYPIIQSPNNGYNMLSDKTNRDIEKYIVKLTNMALKQAINIILSNYDKFVVIADDLIKKRELDELYLSKIDIIYY